jgi:hypothetical protein
VDRLSGKPVELGPAPHREQVSWQAGGCGCLTPGWCLSQQDRAPVVPHGAGARQGLMGWVGSGHSTHGWGSAEPEGQWPGGRGRARVWCRLVVGILVVMGQERRVFRRGMAGTTEGQVSHHMWVWSRAVAWCNPRGGEPGRMEQRLCRSTGWRFGRPAVLILDHSVVKPPII